MASYQTNWFKCPLKSGSSLPTNCATFWNEKFWCGTLFLHKNKTRNVRRSEKAQLNKRDLSDPYFPDKIWYLEEPFDPWMKFRNFEGLKNFAHTISAIF